MKRFIRFPWRVYWRYFSWQVVAFNGLYLAVISVIDVRHGVRPFVYNEALLNFLVFSILVSAITSYRFAKPIHRVILKALRISSKRTFGSLVKEQEDDLADDETADISELELALDRIHRKMKNRKARYLQSQEESQAFMSAVAEGLVSVSLDEKILYFNSQFAAQFLSSAIPVVRPSERSDSAIEGCYSLFRRVGRLWQNHQDRQSSALYGEASDLDRQSTAFLCGVSESDPQ
ncbi:hypothetical protein [Bdellovibrio bacteriovorus]|uniref:hypothetical protein n=1 Tax=Bdellovibrio bacteriovorus TaxID=959 RepID=UPI001E2DC983|nr:hypothetical protein [Bdellovibrio bacteriovorus]